MSGVAMVERAMSTDPALTALLQQQREEADAARAARAADDAK